LEGGAEGGRVFHVHLNVEAEAAGGGEGLEAVGAEAMEGGAAEEAVGAEDEEAGH